MTDRITGIAACGGCAMAPAFLYRPTALPDPAERRSGDQTVEQAQDLVDQAALAVDQALALAASRANQEGQQILEMHRVMLADAMFRGGIAQALEEGWSPGAAVVRSTQALVDMLLALDDPMFTMRIPDTREIGARLCCQLAGRTYPDLSCLEHPVILMGEDLPPSLLTGENAPKVAGVVMGGGNRTCHAAILCAALGVPALMGAAGWDTAKAGDLVYVDGDAGEAAVVPPEAASRYTALLTAHQAEQALLLPYLDAPTRTADGETIGLYCNIFSRETAQKAQSLNADGAGLFRTEFLYTGRPDLPGEEEQMAVYRAALEAMPGKSITFRTMDIGGDKPVESLALEQEQNAFLGYRAIRISLDRPELFRTQLRALLRASMWGQVQILFPMISGVDELRRAKAQLELAKEELRQRGLDFAPHIPVGIMIEVPSAAILADELAREADFFSIGSNDLTQYTLAVDRMNPKVAYLSDPLHPAVLRLMRGTIDAARKAGIPCSVCGELAGMEEAVPVLLSMGLKKFSVSPNRVLAVRRLISQWRP